MITGQLVAAVAAGGGEATDVGVGGADVSGCLSSPADVNGVPQSVQNRNDAGFLCPQTAHATPTEAPQLPQNLAFAGFSKAQLWQVIELRTHPSFRPPHQDARHT